ncbi:MAG: DUF1624 domain-containing protein [Rhodobacter sp.]|nr:DUF1624 domain-containing protein [Paracoccaceae bacterium]MCB1408704.1 DUF1624 domain-containing protein [Paracoccaceae bacterium]MCC0080359.1 DUF1624 domain-containing protein [Rhodobacter sp.]
MSSIPDPLPSARRLPGVDIARGVALIGMVIFHFTLDLEMFGQVPQGTIESPPWMVFARLVAGSFVFLAGLSLVLGHGAGIRWRPFLTGTGQIAAGALAVTLATYAAMPWMFVFFGILHSIALSRVLGLAFLRLPVPVLVLAAAAVWIAPYLWPTDAMNPRWLAWIGFAAEQPLSMDLEPVFPWFAPFLLGMAAARLGLHHALPAPRWLTPLAWPGRHSLAVYLIHQPVIFGTLWLIFVGLR